ncbi:MAG: LysE family transporter [Pseudonocardiales bacterium]|nr:LysE family transporter [Pseudonocardiales bacterium]
MLGINWLAFVPAAALISVVPGANQLLGLRNALRQGTAAATVALVGRFTAFALLVVVVATGLGAVLKSSVVAFEIIKWLGVAYLTWLGFRTLWRSFRPARHSVSEPSEAPPCSRSSLVRQEFVVAITNPKALLLFAAFLPQFIMGTGPAWAQLLVLGGAYIGIEWISAFGYTLVGGRLGKLDLTRRVSQRLDQITAICFLGLACYLSFS